MKEMSNSTLALMVVAAILVSIIGSFISLTKLSEIGATGYASSGTGLANLSVPSTVDITVVDQLIELGTVEQGQANDSDQADIQDFWLVNNTGSVNVSLRIRDTSQNAEGAGDGTNGFTGTTGCAATDTCFYIKCNSTQSGYDCNDTYYTTETAYGRYYIYDLSSDAADAGPQAVFGVNISVPDNEQAGNKEWTVDIQGAQS